MGLYCVGARLAVPLHYEAATVSLTWTMAETMIKVEKLKEIPYADSTIKVQIRIR